ncbi:MAG: hypothetical protein M1820_006484 [Bogoriella megaspora]|nr:MAG: hypothetical protein M1820_006484 [Bogoriella megaspora]
MIDILLDCGVYVPVEGTDNLSQISGTPLSELTELQKDKFWISDSKSSVLHHEALSKQKPKVDQSICSPTKIRILRHRILYARAVFTGKGNIRLGLPHLHVFNRYKDPQDATQTHFVMHYLFPRQYGLHNVFTATANPKETSHMFKDYTLREREIIRAAIVQQRKKASTASTRHETSPLLLPRRLRGAPMDLVTKVRKSHLRCSYTELLNHYCPVDPCHGTGRNVSNQHERDGRGFTSFATPVSQVSAYCRAVILTVFPSCVWGDAESAVPNRSKVLHQIHRFLQARKQETISLHEILEGIKVQKIPWLAPRGMDQTLRLSRTDFQKRIELLLEFLYFVFDSFLTPLVRSNFYVTDSNENKNQLFYFRHDVWRKLAEPSLSQLKLSLFAEMDTKKAMKVLEKRTLNYGEIRLLPKHSGVRPIANLKKRLQTCKDGKLVLDKSINKVMEPVFHAVRFEKNSHPEKAGSSLFSVRAMYPKLCGFKSSLQAHGLSNQPLYFAKVDVRSCFDSLPQKKLLALAEGLLSAESYRTAKHAEIRSLSAGNASSGAQDAQLSITRKFIQDGYNGSDFRDFQDMVDDGLSRFKTKTVFVDSVVQSVHKRDELLKLLSEHLEKHLVKIGRKYYRQNEGIPQGSIMSNLLCNLLFGQLEKQFLAFTSRPGTLLLRMVDDFLIISTRQSDALHFLQIMHNGIPSFGVSIKPEKSLTNFPARANNFSIGALPLRTAFPYCGTTIDTTTLDVSKDIARSRASGPVSERITVEFSKTPGRAFQRKTLSALTSQMHGMFLDTRYNDAFTVLSNLYANYVETAQKCFAYIKALPTAKQPTLKLLIKTVENVVALSVALMAKRGKRVGVWKNYECSITRGQAEWLCYAAFGFVFGRKQTKFPLFIAWLAKGVARTKVGGREKVVLERVVAQNS